MRLHGFGRRASSINRACVARIDRVSSMIVRYFTHQRHRSIARNVDVAGLRRFLGSPHETGNIPSSGIFRASVANWLCACVSLRRSRNIKAKARKASSASSALNQHTEGIRWRYSFQRPCSQCGKNRELIGSRPAIIRRCRNRSRNPQLGGNPMPFLVCAAPAR